VGLCVREAVTALADAGWAGEVVVVDNGSTDGSREVASAAGARVVREERRGYGSALLAGFEAARGDIVVMADADFTYDLSKMGLLIGPVARDEADLVIGARLDAATRRSMPLLHRFVGTPALTFLVARACGRRVVTDSQSGFRAFRRDRMAALGLRSSGMELASEMLVRAARAGLRVTEVQAGYRERIGSSKLETFTDGRRHVQLILLLAPDLLLVLPGAVLFAFGLALAGLGFLRPSGVAIGSLRWQPVFFSGIATVLGVQALLAGMVLANRSSVAVPPRFAFVGRPEFPGRCLAGGLVAILAGLAADFVLFLGWVGGRASPPVHGLGLASLAQSLIIVGGTLASFGIVSRALMARDRAAAPASDAVAEERDQGTTALRKASSA